MYFPIPRDIIKIYGSKQGNVVSLQAMRLLVETFMIDQVTITVGTRTYQLKKSTAITGWVEMTKKHGSLLGNYPANEQGGMALRAFFASEAAEDVDALATCPAAEKFAEVLAILA